MKFSGIALACIFLFIDTAIGRVPGVHERIDPARARRSRPLIHADGPTSVKAAAAPRNASHAKFSNAWAGAILESPPVGQTFTTVKGTFTVPTLTGDGSASAWVGIDGDTARNSILQAGVDFVVNGGEVLHQAWYEWLPEDTVYLANFPISAGQSISLSVHANSSTTGTVVLTNASTGKSITQLVTAPSSSAALAGLNAEWIIEDFQVDGSLVPFADFGTVTFTDASASTASDSSVGLSGATIYNILQNNEVLTNVSVSGSSVIITHL